MGRNATTVQRSVSKAGKHLLRILQRHVGERKHITIAALARALQLNASQAEIFVDELRHAGIAVCGCPIAGYFIAATADELKRTCDSLHARGLESLTLESKLLHIPLPDLIERMRLEI